MPVAPVRPNGPSKRAFASYSGKELRELHLHGRSKAARTRYVQVPLGIVVPRDKPEACAPSCVGCEFQPTTSSTRAVLTSREVRRLAYGEGIGIRVLLALYRWARAYAGTPGAGGLDARVRNASARFSIGNLAAASLGDNTTNNRRAVRVAMRKLRQFGLVEVIGDAGRESFYIPHAIGTPARLPQHLWPRERPSGRDGRPSGQTSWMLRRRKDAKFALDGKTLWLLLMLLGLTHTSSDGRIAHELDATNQLPISSKERRAAVRCLVDLNILQEFRTQGRNYLIVIEPD